MPRYLFCLLLVFIIPTCTKQARGQEPAGAVARALADGDAFRKQRDYDNAMSAYRKADKLSHHTCADAFLDMCRLNRELGNLPAALEDAKQAVKAAGENKAKAAQAHLVRSALLARMASKPNDKKLKEAESEVREVLVLAPDLPIAHLNLGRILVREERDSEGIPELKNYLASPVTDPKSVIEARRIIANPIRGREPFAPDFAFVSLEGESVSNAALRGKVVLLDFWGTWCPVCRESLPMVLNLRKKYRDRPFEIVGISSDNDEQVLKRYIITNHMDWPEFLDSSNEVRQAFDVNAYPTFMLVDRDGVITYSQAGWSSEMQSDLEELINKSLKKPSNPALLEAIAPSVSQNPVPEPAANLPGALKFPAASTETGAPAAAGVVSRGVYRNQELGFSYQLPPNWTAVAPQIVQAASEKAQANLQAKFLEQHPEQRASMHLNLPSVVFYASRSGQGDGQRLSFPCARISAWPATGAVPTLGQVKARAQAIQPPGVTMAGDPEEFTVDGQEFLRMELVNSTPKVWVSRIVTIIHGQLVALEFFAIDQQELEGLISTPTLRMMDAAASQQANAGMANPGAEHGLQAPGGTAAATARDASSEGNPGVPLTSANDAAVSFGTDMRQAEILKREGDLEGAIGMYRQAVQAQPNEIKGHRLLADALAQKRDRAGAILEYQEVVKLEPGNAEYHFTLGAQLEARGASAGYARGDFSKQPGSLALPKTAQADYEAALEQYQLAHQLAPQNSAYTEAYERMKSRLRQD
jgi:tetratricopeptide (TPR) repeat protein/peroxiredoxin